MKNVRANTMRGTVSPKAERWIRSSAVIAMIIVALSSAVLSFDGLQKLALESMIPPHLAFLFPIAIDTTILMGSLAVLLYEMFGIRAVFGWFTVLFGTALSVIGNVISVVDAGITAQVLHGIIPILLCISLESLLRILRFNIKRTVSMENEDHMDSVDSKPVVAESIQTAALQPEPVLEVPVDTASNLEVASEAIERTSPAVVEPEPVSLPTYDLSVLEASVSVPEVKAETPMTAEMNITETKVEKTETVKPIQHRAQEAPSSKPMKKPATKRGGVGYAPLASDEREQFKALVDTFPEDYPVYKRLGEVMRVNSKISSADVRYILSYEEDKRVDNLMKRAREFAVNS